MAHLDTAYKLGAARAVEDFTAEVQKQALAATAPPPQGGGGGAAPVGGLNTAPGPAPKLPPMTRQPGAPPPAMGQVAPAGRAGAAPAVR